MAFKSAPDCRKSVKEGVGAQGAAGSNNQSALRPISLVASATPDGQYVTTELEDAQGTFTLTPAPTNDFDSRFDSIVALTATEQDVGSSSSAAEIPPLHIGTILHGGTGATPASFATFAAAPLTGLAFQISSNLALSTATGPGMVVGQFLADQVFQALAHGAINQSDPTLGSTPKESLALLRLPLAADDLEDLNWSEVASNRIAPAATPHAPGDQAAVDQYFAQAADDMPMILDDE